MVALKIQDRMKWDEHRSGWSYVLSLLDHYTSDKGILFDGAVDTSFAKWYRASHKHIHIPYEEDWIGFIHSAPTSCPFLKNYATFDTVLPTEGFLRSLERCRGLFTLSEHSAQDVRRKLGKGINVNSIKHPTETPDLQFDMHKFSLRSKIVHVGNWLRRMISFFNLACPLYNKVLLLNPATLRYLSEELEFYKEVNVDFKSVEIRQHLSNIEYDELLAESIVFIHLCDSSATNTIIECMVRNTPVLVNKITPVIEYLGEDYPFYYSTLEEAEMKLKDPGNIWLAHEYLKAYGPTIELTGKHFLNSFSNSEIIKQLSRERAFGLPEY